MLVLCNSTGDFDYYSGPYNVVIPAAVTNATFYVQIMDDKIIEGNETFILTIKESTLPNNIVLGSFGGTIVNIVDNDRKSLNFI